VCGGGVKGSGRHCRDGNDGEIGDSEGGEGSNVRLWPGGLGVAGWRSVSTPSQLSAGTTSRVGVLAACHVLADKFVLGWLFPRGTSFLRFPVTAVP
jgi:hypothetical protein